MNELWQVLKEHFSKGRRCLGNTEVITKRKKYTTQILQESRPILCADRKGLSDLQYFCTRKETLRKGF